MPEKMLCFEGQLIGSAGEPTELAGEVAPVTVVAEAAVAVTAGTAVVADLVECPGGLVPDLFGPGEDRLRT